jgi:formamidopyrimidine-DNA glycosylase
VPELPEVETTRRGIAPLVEACTVVAVTVRETRLRQPVPANLAELLCGHELRAVERRAKYLLFRFAHGTLIVHLGMSGSLRVVPPETAFKKHDHIEITFANERRLRFHDPRRFGLMIWSADPVESHPLIAHLGPEPWDEQFDAAYLHAAARSRRAAVKNVIMDGRIVVGVGNIYASEALYRAGVHPKRAAGRVSIARYARLVLAIREVLAEAIEVGGTTLRDFVKSDGEPGYFRLQLNVYGRAGEPCPGCRGLIRQAVIGQRSSFYCPVCQR